MTVIERARAFPDRVAISDDQGEHTYAELLGMAERVAGILLAGRQDLQESRVGFMITPSCKAVAALWGIWMAGGIAVPLCTTHPLPEVEYVLTDAGIETVLFSKDHEDTVVQSTAKTNRHALDIETALAASCGNQVALSGDRRALILYTSGTTGKPKGAVTTHNNISAQISCLVEAWEWTANDRILLVLPLHHTHGLINVVSCALWSGAACEMMARFDADEAWKRFVDSPLTLFMAVPTIYVKLISAWQATSAGRQSVLSRACQKMRLMVSGSAALPTQVFDQWHQITGHILLERYGMTEIGMALSNPLHGERRRGRVGAPLPRVEIRQVDDMGHPVSANAEPGELYVRGPGVFLEYWNRAQETEAAFDKGWFKTGDIAVREQGCYRILGRSSVDIIKTAGFKVSALEIEEILRSHPHILECSVVGVTDLEWGERVSAACVLKPGEELELEALRIWAKKKMAPYKVPSRLLLLDALPKNAMGKVTKPELRRLFDGQKA